jgi:hypothetical protein
LVGASLNSRILGYPLFYLRHDLRNDARRRIHLTRDALRSSATAYPRRSSPNRVAERLVAVFRGLPNTPIYSSRKGVFA